MPKPMPLAPDEPTADEWQGAMRLKDAPPHVRAAARAPVVRRRGKQRAPTKVMIALRVDQDTAARLRATGKGWQSRAGDALHRFARRAS